MHARVSARSLSRLEAEQRRAPAPRAARRPRRSGFALLELLVVLAVITLLTVLLLPLCSRARHAARQMTCLSNLKQITVAHLLYLQDFDEQLPHWWQGGPPRPHPFGSTLYWTDWLQPYLRCDALFRDPAAAGWQPLPPELKLADYALITFYSMAPRARSHDPAASPGHSFSA